MAHSTYMATPFLSIKTLLNQAALVTPEQFEMWGKQWRTAVEGGSDDSLMTFFSREKGITEEQFLKKLAKTLDWPFIDLQGIGVPPEVRARISTKVA
ncbi:type II/IV secretion system protein, partial [bacterium]|nr:type II/IV secretion system protein [bacterium]